MRECDDVIKAIESKGLELLAAENLRRSFALELGAVTETVAVSGMAALVNTVAAEQRETFSRTDVTELALSRRNYSTLLGVGTGVTYTTGRFWTAHFSADRRTEVCQLV